MSLVFKSDYEDAPATYIAAVESADGQDLEEEVKSAYTEFILGCISDGTWDAIKSSCILSGARTLAGALVPLKGIAPTNNGPFVAADYNRKTGLVGNNSKYLNANRLGDADPTNNEHQSVYVTTGTLGNGNHYIGSSDGTNFRSIAWTSGLGAYVYTNTTSVSGTSVGSPASPTGLIGHSRNNASTFDFFVRNNLTKDINQTSSAAPNTDTNIFALNGANFSSGRIAFYSIGEALDLSLLNIRISNFITTIDSLIL